MSRDYYYYDYDYYYYYYYYDDDDHRLFKDTDFFKTDDLFYFFTHLKFMRLGDYANLSYQLFICCYRSSLPRCGKNFHIFVYFLFIYTYVVAQLSSSIFTTFTALEINVCVHPTSTTAYTPCSEKTGPFVIS